MASPQVEERGAALEPRDGAHGIPEAASADGNQLQSESGVVSSHKKRVTKTRKLRGGGSGVAVEMPRAASHDGIFLKAAEPPCIARPVTVKEVTTSMPTNGLEFAREPSPIAKQVPKVAPEFEQAPQAELQVRPSWNQAEEGSWRVSSSFEPRSTQATDCSAASAVEWTGSTNNRSQSLTAQVGGNSREKLTLREALPESHSLHSSNPSRMSSGRLKTRLKKFRRYVPGCVFQFHARLVAVLIGMWVVFGLIALGSEAGENLGLVDALYVMTQVLTTIGYGDLTSWENDGMKFFLSFYALFGMVVVASVIAVLGKEMQQSSQDLLMNRWLNVRHQEDESPQPAPLSQGMRKTFIGKLEGQVSSKVRRTVMFQCLVRFQGVVTSGLLVLVALLIGTLFYGTYEACSCGRYEGKVEDCDRNSCEETGGYTKSYLDAWYMSCISLSTVGFGDFAPVSTLGRCFAIVWMILGVIAVANFQVEVSKILLKNDTVSRILDTDLDDLFDIFDKDGDGNLDAHEFLVFALLEGGLVERETITQIQDLFASLDMDRDGSVSRGEIRDRFEVQRDEEAHDQSWFPGVFHNAGISNSSIWSKSSTWSEADPARRTKRSRGHESSAAKSPSSSAATRPRMSKASSATSGSILGRPQTPTSQGAVEGDNDVGKSVETE
mmetsp:Transcript_15429/g.35224  ORF Transcript_15429/g.35224 Transcript_15429/m.35224 type:complete len:665 (+) Transcript_15429:108-2102(+)